jgi:hypothetical protein
MRAGPEGAFAVQAVERLGPFTVLRRFLRAPSAARVRAAHSGERALETGADEIGPLHELRPRQARRLAKGNDPLTAEQAAAMRASHAELSGILDAARGRPLTEGEIRRLIRLINPTRDVDNCFEGSLALDEALGGTAKVAGPSSGRRIGTILEFLSRKSMSELRDLRPDQIGAVEAELKSAEGARGIMVRYSGDTRNVPHHAYNVVNAEGKILYLDAQIGDGRVFESNPSARLSTYHFFRTA